MKREYALSLFTYKQGFLYWKVTPNGRAQAGERAGCYTARYAQVGIDGKKYRLHRIIFLMHHGYLPKIVDHIDGNRWNNRIENLREASSFQNVHNAKNRAQSSSKYKGVSYEPERKLWRASICCKGVKHRIGRFKNEKDAARAYDDYARKLQGEYARPNFPTRRPK